MMKVAVALITALLLTSCAPGESNRGISYSSTPSSSTPTATATQTSTPTLTPIPETPVSVPEVEEPLSEPAPPASDPLADVTPQLLTLNIAGYGGQGEIDACIGWIIYTPYEGHDVQPTIAEHNNCGGAAILGLPIGAKLRLAGAGLDGLYEIVDSRDAPQQGTTLDIQGIAGEILAQSCYFNSEYMRFIGLVRVG
jgi:hypothetical protein